MQISCIGLPIYIDLPATEVKLRRITELRKLRSPFVEEVAQGKSMIGRRLNMDNTLSVMGMQQVEAGVVTGNPNPLRNFGLLPINIDRHMSMIMNGGLLLFITIHVIYRRISRVRYGWSLNLCIGICSVCINTASKQYDSGNNANNSNTRSANRVPTLLFTAQRFLATVLASSLFRRATTVLLTHGIHQLSIEYL